MNFGIVLLIAAKGGSMDEKRSSRWQRQSAIFAGCRGAKNCGGARWSRPMPDVAVESREAS
jgi:hypothetical protein